MKTNFKRIGKQSISIVLAVMMMLSTMLVGMVTSNAVDIKANTVFYLDIRNATEYFNNPNSIYMSVVGADNDGIQSADDAIEGQQYKPPKDTWYQMKQIDNSNIYEVTVTDSSSIGKVSFWNNYRKGYNTIYDVSCALCKTYDGEKNLFTLSSKSVQYDNKKSRSFDGTWSKYESTEPTKKYSVTYTDPTDSEGVESASIDPSEATLAEGTNVTVTVTVNKGYTASLDVDGAKVEKVIDGNIYKFTFSMPAQNITVAPKVTKNATPSSSNTVYLRVDVRKYSPNFSAYIWKNSDKSSIFKWDNFKEMTLVASEDDNIKIYSYTPDEGTYLKDYDSIIFRYNNDVNSKINAKDITGETLQGRMYDVTSDNSSDWYWSDYTVQTKYDVNIASYDAEKGNVSISPSQSLAQGETFKVNAVPNTGYSVDKITVTDEDGTEVTKNSDNSYKMPAKDVTVTVTFKLNSHTLTLTEPASGTTGYVNCTITPDQGSVAYGTEVKVVVNVVSGYAASLNLGDVNVTKTVEGNEYTFTFAMPDKDITVAPTVSAKGVPTPVISLGAAVATGGTLKAYVNEPKTITAAVGLPEGEDDTYVVVDTDKTGYVDKITYTAADGSTQQLEINDYIVPSNANSLNYTDTKTFKFNKVGKYQITYNGALKSTVDSTKTSSANATLTVDVTYSATQQAYIDLKKLTDDTTNYPETVSDTQYTSGVEAYNTARANAKTAVEGGFPAYDADDTYTALNEALVNAKNNLVVAKAFYIGGKFKTSVIDNTANWVDHPTEIDKDGNPKAGQEIKFEAVTSTLYKVETNLDITANNGNYFFVYSKSGTFYRDYGAPSNTVFNGKTSLSNSQTLTNTGYNEHQLYFNDVASAPNAVMWLDTSGLADDGTGSMKLFYTSGTPTAKYSLTGGDSKGAKVDWASGWNTYDAQYTVNEPTDNPFVFSKTIDVNDENGAYFRINTSSAQYGPSKDQTEITSVKSTTITTSNNAFKIPSGSYRLFVDQSGATPVIWVSQADYNVSVMGSYSFNGTSYNAITQTEKPTVTISSPTVSVGQAVTVTTTNDFDGYEFVGWVSTNGTFADASKLETTFTPNADNAVAIARYAKMLSVNVSLADGSKNGTWSIGEVNANVSTYRAGSVVSVSFTPENEDDIITSVTVEGKEYVTSLENNKLNFTVGVADETDSEVQVVVTFAERPKYYYSFDYVTGCESMGTVVSIDNNGQTLNEGEYTYGTDITLKATANEGYVFKGWYSDINGTGECLSTNATYKFTLTENTEVFAKFAEATGTMIPNLYLIYSDSSSKPSDFTKYLNLYCDADGQVYAYFDSADFDTSKEYRFMISNSVGKSTSWEYAYKNYNNSEALANESNKKYLDCGKNNHWLPMEGESSSVQVFFARFRVLDDYADTVSSVKINLGYYDGTDIVESSTDSTKATTYEIIPDATSTVSSRVKVYAKDGTIRANYQKYADMADTKISYTGDDVTKLKSATYYEEGYAKLGSTIKVTTTIAEPYRRDYYVKAFSVNGYSYGIIDSSKANADGVYSFEYTIPEDCTDKFIEITPIYYYIDDTNTVTFYVEGFDETVQAKWGNTVAVQAWYTNGVDEQKYVDGVLEGEYNSPNKNALGGYPGQPLVYEGGKYSMQIPKYLNGKQANKVSGITLNNYIWDDVHKLNFSSQINDNAQTYDYDDFYKLSDTADVDNIIFDFRYRTKTDNAPSQDGLSSSTYNKNELENLTDYYGNIVNIFGNILSENWETDYDSQYLTVISDGYINNYIGKYATNWAVYDHDGKYITTINCSNLIDENKVDKTYTTAYNALKPYANLPVKIAYEKSIFQGPDNGDRADGRWYFSKKEQKITANVQIQYRTDDNSPFVEDKFDEGSNAGATTGAQAYFTNADYNGKTTCQGTVDGGKFSVHAQTDANANYYFIGWYLKTSDGYSFITNESDADFPMTNSETYVARFITTPSGTLTLSHTLLDGSADGKTFIKADIVDSKGNIKASIAETSGNLVVPSRYVTYPSSYKINVTLRTVPYGNDTVDGFYEGYSVDTPTRYPASFVGSGEKIYNEISRDIESLFKKDVDAEGNVSYSLIKSNIPFYSKITSQPLDYKITYTYKTRLNGEQSYVIKDKVSGIELEEMWAANEAAGLTKEQLSKKFITKKAPFVSNYREEIKWKIDEATIKDYIATVLATTEPVKLNISALPVAGDYAGSWTAPAPVEYGELAKSNGDYLYKTGTTEFPETFNYSGNTDYAFSFWAIFDNPDAAKKYSNAVATYMSSTPAENMSERLTKLTNLEGYKNLISKSYSKEYNYVSYQDYYIVPVYAGRFAKNEINELQASIRRLEYTRNQWTTGNGVKGDGTENVGGSKTDYLYTDFALSFDKNQLLIQNNPNIKVGVAFEIVARYDDVKPLDSYVIGSDEAAIRKLVKDATESSIDNGKVGTYEMVDKSRSVYKYEINNSKISEKNRIEYYLRFNNTKNAQQNVMKVYSYIYDTHSGEVFLSDPEYMNMYDIGNLTYITSDLASINLQPATEIG